MLRAFFIVLVFAGFLVSLNTFWPHGWYSGFHVAGFFIAWSYVIIAITGAVVFTRLKAT